MANPQIVPKKSTVSGKIPATTDLSLGEICINHSDKIIYAKNPSSGEVYQLTTASGAVNQSRVWVFGLNGNNTFLGCLGSNDFPSSGSIYDSPMWEIFRTVFNSSMTSFTEASATGAWSNRESLIYS